jgi:hypothetical protein
MMVLFIVTAVRTSNTSTRVAPFAALSSLNILSMFKLREMRWKGYVARMGKMRIAY